MERASESLWNQDTKKQGPTLLVGQRKRLNMSVDRTCVQQWQHVLCRMPWAAHHRIRFCFWHTYGRCTG
jgi:hypothetical protein